MAVRYPPVAASVRLRRLSENRTREEAVMPTSKAPRNHAAEPASTLIDAQITERGGWRAGERLARLRGPTKKANPGVIEEWKRAIPVWSRDGLICTGETHKKVVKMTFAKGASPVDPEGRQSPSRAIDMMTTTRCNILHAAPALRLWPICLAALLAACGDARPEGFQGYIEGDYLLVAPSQGGQLDKLHVQRGQVVAAKAPLFELDPVAETAAVREAAERVRSAEARASNLDTPRRAAEVQALKSQVAQAEAAHALAVQQLRRAEELQPIGAIATADLDTARRNLEQQTARKAELQADLGLARQSIGRAPERQGAQADADTARAVLAQSEWRLAQRSVAAPAGAVVQDTFYSAGEWVPAGKPVLSLLPPGNVKLRFFVPEPVIGSLKLGQAMNFRCDGCGAPMVATISHLSTQAEYTPPILYNRQSRAKLVFMVEARPAPADAPRLHPGQPVDVTAAAP